MGITLAEARLLKDDMTIHYKRRTAAAHIVNLFEAIEQIQERLDVHKKQLEA